MPTYTHKTALFYTVSGEGQEGNPKLHRTYFEIGVELADSSYTESLQTFLGNATFNFHCASKYDSGRLELRSGLIESDLQEGDIFCYDDNESIPVSTFTVPLIIVDYEYADEHDGNSERVIGTVYFKLKEEGSNKEISNVSLYKDTYNSGLVKLSK